MKVNTLFVSGNLTADAVLEQTPQGTPICRFRIGVNSWREADETMYLSASLFGKRATGLTQYLSKGQGVLVQGRLQYSTWEKDGEKREQYRIVANDVQLIPKRGGRESDGARERDDEVPF